MEIVSKTSQFKKRKYTTKLQSIYSRCLLTRKICILTNYIDKNLNNTIEEYIHDNYEGMCVVEGYVKPGSSKIISYSSGIIERGNKITFEVVFECDVCFFVEGMLIPCLVKSVVKAGIKAESLTEVPTPFVAFVSKDHHFNSHYFSSIKVGDTITVRVIGQRYELNDSFVNIICELVKERDFSQNPTKLAPAAKPRLVIE